MLEMVGWWLSGMKCGWNASLMRSKRSMWFTTICYYKRRYGAALSIAGQPYLFKDPEFEPLEEDDDSLGCCPGCRSDCAFFFVK